MADFEQPSPLDAEVLNDVPEPPRPQLRLHHFFVFTAIAAAIMALTGPLIARWSNGNEQMPGAIALVSMSWSMLHSFCVAAAMTAVAYGIAWRRRGIPFFDQPGHWLFVEIGVTGVLWLVAYAFLFRLIDSAGGSSFSWAVQFFWVIALAFTVGTFGLNIYIAWKKCHEWRWKSVFILKSLSFVAQTFQSLHLGAIAVAAATLIAVRRDRRQHIVRDGAHWCGVVLELVTCALALGAASMRWFFA